MPCILKEHTPTSPGIVTFTQNEVLRGTLAKSSRARKFLLDSAQRESWLFGVHIQGFLGDAATWPLEPWQSFVMWPNRSAPFLSSVPAAQQLGLNCINFMPSVPQRLVGLEKNVDICVVSRPSAIKRIYETLLIIRELMNLRSDLTATIIVPDYRRVGAGDACYQVHDLDRRFYELPRKLFSACELKQLSFLCSSEECFGRLPLANGLMTDLLHRSRFLLLTSHREGTPRVLAEALMTGVPCIVSKNLECGIIDSLNSGNCLFIDDETPAAATQIHEALTNYQRYRVDADHFSKIFGADTNKWILQSWLSGQVASRGKAVEGRWFLDDLHLRLAGHGQKYNLQFMNRPKLFFRWFDCVSQASEGASGQYDPYDEDRIFADGELNDDQPSLSMKNVEYVKRVITRGANVVRRKFVESGWVVPGGRRQDIKL